jgi:hypothetical protein
MGGYPTPAPLGFHLSRAIELGDADQHVQVVGSDDARSSTRTNGLNRVSMHEPPPTARALLENQGEDKVTRIDCILERVWVLADSDLALFPIIGIIHQGKGVMKLGEKGA